MLGILDLSGTDVLGQIILCWWGRGEGLPIVVTAAVSVGSVHKMPVLIPLNPSCGDYKCFWKLPNASWGQTLSLLRIVNLCA